MRGAATENFKTHITIACTGVTGRPFFQLSITRRDRGDAYRCPDENYGPKTHRNERNAGGFGGGKSGITARVRAFGASRDAWDTGRRDVFVNCSRNRHCRCGRYWKKCVAPHDPAFAQSPAVVRLGRAFRVGTPTRLRPELLWSVAHRDSCRRLGGPVTLVLCLWAQPLSALFTARLGHVAHLDSMGTSRPMGVAPGCLVRLDWRPDSREEPPRRRRFRFGRFRPLCVGWVMGGAPEEPSQVCGCWRVGCHRMVVMPSCLDMLLRTGLRCAPAIMRFVYF